MPYCVSDSGALFDFFFFFSLKAVLVFLCWFNASFLTFHCFFGVFFSCKWMDLLCFDDWIDVFVAPALWFNRWKRDLLRRCVDPVCVFTLQSPRPLHLPPGFRAAQCSDPTRAALRCLCNSCRCHFSVPRLHRGCVRPVLRSRHGRSRRRCLWAVPVRSLASTHELHDDSGLRLHRPAAARHSCHPRSCCGCCCLQPVSTSAAPGRSNAVKLWITPRWRKEPPPPTMKAMLHRESVGWVSPPGFNAEPFLPKSLKKITKKCWQMRNCCMLLKWDWYFVTIEYIFVFNIY